MKRKLTFTEPRVKAEEQYALLYSLFSVGIILAMKQSIPKHERTIDVMRRESQLQDLLEGIGALDTKQVSPFGGPLWQLNDGEQYLEMTQVQFDLMLTYVNAAVPTVGPDLVRPSLGVLDMLSAAETLH